MRTAARLACARSVVNRRLLFVILLRLDNAVTLVPDDMAILLLAAGLGAFAAVEKRAAEIHWFRERPAAGDCLGE